MLDEIKKAVSPHFSEDEMKTLNEMGDKKLAAGIVAYHKLVKSVAEKHTNDTSADELLAERPELAYMDIDEIEDVLILAKKYRK